MMNGTAQALHQNDPEGSRNADFSRLVQENLHLQKRLDAMAEEIAWLKRVHDKELEYRERELALREKSQPAGAAGGGNGLIPSAIDGIDQANGHGHTDRREMSAVDMHAILEATLNGLMPELEEAQPTAPAPPVPLPEVLPGPASAEPAATPTVEASPKSNDEYPAIPAFLADPAGRHKKLAQLPSALPVDNDPPRTQRLAPKRRRLSCLIG